MLLLMIFTAFTGAASHAHAANVNLLVLGDSLSDTGNGWQQTEDFFSGKDVVCPVIYN
jgi:hypothetical protein